MLSLRQPGQKTHQESPEAKLFAEAIAALEIGSAKMFEALCSHLATVDVNSFAPHIRFEKKPEHLQCLKFLLSHNLNPNTEIFHDPLLARAARKNNIEACRYLLEAGANPNEAQAEQPLVTATYARNKELVRLLVKHGANTQEAFEIARKRRYADIITLLKPANDEEMAIDIEDPSDHYYIHCSIAILGSNMIGYFEDNFFILMKEPKALNHLPFGITANCNFAQLKERVPKLNKDEVLPNDLVDYGIDKEHDDYLEMIKADFYYDCSDLDLESVLKVVEMLKAKHYRGALSDFTEASEMVNYNESFLVQDLAKMITQYLLGLQPALNSSPKLFKSNNFNSKSRQNYLSEGEEMCLDTDSFDEGYSPKF